MSLTPKQRAAKDYHQMLRDCMFIMLVNSVLEGRDDLAFALALSALLKWPRALHSPIGKLQ